MAEFRATKIEYFKPSGVDQSRMVTCPCGCNHTFRVQFTRVLSSKELAARKKNAKLAGRKQNVELGYLWQIFSSRSEWTGEELRKAIAGKTGVVYSISQSYSWLKILREHGPSVADALKGTKHVK